MPTFISIFAATILLSSAVSVSAQAPKHEMRGAWIATVINLDWPANASASTEIQKSELLTLFNSLEARGINAVFFQIRSEADAMYASELEPWSVYLTGEQGRAPDPAYDPLAFAINLAHNRGMELHAWMNPFRAERDTGAYQTDPSHVTNTHPEWIVRINDLKILDPGHPDARAYIVDVVRDVVRRYDVDGIHFDDYFYPYPPDVILLEDEDTYAQFGGSFTNMADWRRDNINRFVADVHTAIQDQDPNVKFGISPFGIWKDGVPSGTSGLSAYDVIYADATHWMANETIDYLAPQLYWPFGGGQDFALLADWWASVSNGIHIYPGLAAYRVDAATAGSNRFEASVLPEQIRYSRDVFGVEGNILFRASNLDGGADLGLSDSLSSSLYRNKALTPPMLYKDTFPPAAPDNLTATSDQGSVSLRWDPPLSGFAFANRFGVYRASGPDAPDARDMTQDPANLLAVSYRAEYADREALVDGRTYHYTVTGITPNSIEGEEAAVVSVVAISTGVDAQETPSAVSIDVYPNPAVRQARVDIELDRAAHVKVWVADGLGREVARLYDERLVTPGAVEVDWDLTNRRGLRVAPGTYFMIVDVEGRRTTRGLVVSR